MQHQYCTNLFNNFHFIYSSCRIFPARTDNSRPGSWPSTMFHIHQNAYSMHNIHLYSITQCFARITIRTYSKIHFPCFGVINTPSGTPFTTAPLQIHHSRIPYQAKTPSELGWCFFPCDCNTKKIGWF